MDEVRVGIIGIGNMGRGHARYIVGGAVPNAVLTAVCDVDQDALQWSSDTLGREVQAFSSADEMLKAGIVDAVLIAVPHYDHAPLAIQCFEAGLHVLVEKPAGVYTKQVREMNEAADKSGKVFGIMFNQRTNPLYQKLRDLVQTGELGSLKRINWIITDWYRPQSYYDSGGWRATWAGEGGGVLLNQDPHQLDLWQWICGMPKRIRAFCGFGKYHDIEVEDDVTAYMEYDDGTTGVFVTSTGDAPGTNRLEISGEQGKVVVEDGQLTFHRLRVSERTFNQEYKGGFGQPECWTCQIPIKGETTGHPGITRNWIDAIRNGSALLAPGAEGIRGLEISNAMHLSAWLDQWAALPVDEELFLSELQKRQKTSSYHKKPKAGGKVLDVRGTH